eukprot:6206597-Pleurochrysis_carterae.AAC.2
MLVLNIKAQKNGHREEKQDIDRVCAIVLCCVLTLASGRWEVAPRPSYQPLVSVNTPAIN